MKRVTSPALRPGSESCSSIRIPSNLYWFRIFSNLCESIFFSIIGIGWKSILPLSFIIAI